MDSQSDPQQPEIKAYSPPKPVIPPPSIPVPPPPPPSALDYKPKSSPPPLSPPPANDAARVKMGSAGSSEPVDLGGAPAAFNTRVTAAVIDCLVALGVTIGLRWILPGFAERLCDLAGLAYFVTRDSLPFLGGQSVGKKAMKLQAVTLDGKSLSENWTAALIRNGVLLIPFFGFIEIYILLTRDGGPERGRRLGDEWAKTRVIVEQKPPAADEIG